MGRSELKRSLAINPGKAALLCVDLQEEHRKDPRYLVAGFDTILAKVQRLQQSARADGIPVVHSAYVVDLGAQPVRPFHPVMPDNTSAFSDVGDPLSAVCPEAGPESDEAILVKTDASAFAHRDTAKLLAEREVEWVFVAGVWTEACIAATVKDAIGLGFRTILVKDACGSGSVAMHQTAVLNIANRLYGGAITDTAGACSLMAGETIDVWMTAGSVPLRFTYENAADLYCEL